MRTYDGATAAYFATQANICARALVWMSAKNRSTGAVEVMGFWNGDDHQQFTIGGVTRLYYGAGSLLQVPPMIYQSGLVVRTHMIEIGQLTPEGAQAIRGYDARLAPIEVHRALFDPLTMVLAAEPHRVFLGQVDQVSITTPEIGGQARCSIAMTTSARSLTKTITQMKSDETQRRRSNDRFRRHIAVSGTVEVVWGEKRASAPDIKKATPPVRTMPRGSDR